jgi:hypothetical protein
MSAQHTPGPWSARHWVCHAATTVVREVDGRVEVIAECSGFGRYADESLADARLIAAAPDLLAALKSLRDNMHAQDLEIEAERPTEDEYQQCMCNAAAAIAKATGSAA